MKNLVAKDIMNADVIVAQDNMTVQELANLLTDNMITGVPVVDDSGKLVGVVSTTDIVRIEHRAKRRFQGEVGIELLPS